MKLKILYCLIFLWLHTLASPLWAQQDPMYTQYMFNMLPINPAYAGSRDVISLTALYRSQWVNVPGAPQTSTFSIDAPIKKEKIGLGLNVFNDRIGVFDNTNFMGMVSYRIRFAKTTLAFGMQGGVTQFKANYADVQTNSDGSATDPAYATNFVRFLPNVGAGVYWSSDRFYLGLSLPHMLNNKINNYVPISASNNYFRASQFRHVFLIAGYVIRLNQDLVLKPSAIYKYVQGAPMQLDLNANLWIYDKFGVGLSYRSLDAISVLFEVQATAQLRFGYSFDYSHSKIRSYTYQSHEFMLRYEFGYNRARVISPRYF